MEVIPITYLHSDGVIKYRPELDVEIRNGWRTQCDFEKPAALGPQEYHKLECVGTSKRTTSKSGASFEFTFYGAPLCSKSVAIQVDRVERTTMQVAAHRYMVQYTARVSMYSSTACLAVVIRQHWIQMRVSSQSWLDCHPANMLPLLLSKTAMASLTSVGSCLMQAYAGLSSNHIYSQHSHNLLTN